MAYTSLQYAQIQGLTKSLSKQVATAQESSSTLETINSFSKIASQINTFINESIAMLQQGITSASAGTLSNAEYNRLLTAVDTNENNLHVLVKQIDDLLISSASTNKVPDPPVES